jgi:Cu/Ag efflux protein CusF
VSHPFVRQYRTYAVILSVIVVAGVFAACGPSRSAKQADAKATTQAQDASVKRYRLMGRVVSIDKANQSISVDGDAIPGFMAAMTMPYQVKDTGILNQAAPGDQIKADIVMGSDGAYLENIVIAPKSSVPNSTK